MVERLNVLKVTLRNGFFILVIPDGEHHNFYLAHTTYGPVLEMFGCTVKTEDDAIELALANANEYIDQYIEEYFDDPGEKYDI